ncbi:TadE family type IV pilus minor pilin [Streptomyces sp. DSM 44915]|uniref:TadE family type IV pilus minor pilin n=1 Tax=Streptomyces chisholmiae TaxID=3075540 RepID=A0ABU2JPT6_9ACTN|nr:TadE family type IV pilus minor pilin [Streptomyces sp. DSM 44915]MDT0266917.1 TadE family type IV pilus minor pilin [Streptomyces sp. DSM 44915]
MIWSNVRSRRRSDGGPGAAGRAGGRGYVTVESALVIPVLLALAGALLGVLGVCATQSLCHEAARSAARAAARGEPVEQVLRVARAVAPDGAGVEVAQDGPLHSVTVSAPSWATRLLRLTPTARVVAHVEPR